MKYVIAVSYEIEIDVNPDSSIIKEYESMQELAEDIATRTRVGIGLPVIGKGVDIVDITLTECDI